MNPSQSPAPRERGAAVPAASHPQQSKALAPGTRAPRFKPFDKEAPIQKTRRLFPHWEQDGCTCFITWRIADAMPAAKRRQWRAELDAWLEQHPKPWDAAVRQEYHNTFEGPVQEWLDAGHGSCALRDPALRDIIASSFHHYDARRYHIGDYIIMPNHVHVLVTPLPGFTHREITAAWKRYTGHEILKRTGGEAPFWLEESFDDIVRSPAQLDHYRRYIRENPAKAFLKPGQWTHWAHPATTAQLCGFHEPTGRNYAEPKRGAAVPAATPAKAAVPAAPLFVATLLLLLTLFGALPSQAQTDFARPAESPVFELNTKAQTDLARPAESPIFELDTTTQPPPPPAISTGEFNLDTRAPTPELTGNGTNPFSVDTRSGAQSSLVVSAPTQVAAGTISPFDCHLTRPNEAPVRVSEQANWSFAVPPPPGIQLLKNSLTLTSTVTPGTQVQVRASYTFLSVGITSQVHTITVSGAALGASASAELVAPHTAAQAVNLKGRAWGGQSPYAMRWDVDGDGAFTDGTGSAISIPFARPAGTYRLALEVTDATGVKKRTPVDIALDKPPVIGQPVRLRPVASAGPGEVYGSDGSLLKFDANKIKNGCVIITHGLRSDRLEPWIKDMASRIDSRLGDKGPNVIVYDWGVNSDPGGQIAPWKLDALKKLWFIRSLLKNVKKKGLDAAVEELAAEEFLRQVDKKLLGEYTRFLTDLDELTDLENLAHVLDFMIDTIFVKAVAQSHGISLSSWIWLNARGPRPLIDPTKPLHLIGHSAGGFVMGEAALYLKRIPLTGDSLATRVNVARVTMLDTPVPIFEHLVEVPNPTHVEQVISSFYGRLESPATWGLQPHAYHSVIRLPGSAYRFQQGDAGHGLAYRWYSRTIRPQGEPDGETLDALGRGGFNLSPILGTPQLNAPRTPRGGSSYGPPVHSVPVTGWDTFGQVTDEGTLWKLTEVANAGLKVNVTLPVGAVSLRLKAKFSSATEGDFLCVRFGDQQDLYHVINTEITRDGLVDVSVPVTGYGGQTGLLVIELISRGPSDAAVSIGKQITITVLDDADSDDLTTEQEVAMGLSPDDPDTDGDELPDGMEVNELGTDPLLPDSDGDGANDGAELAAQTDPLANGSFFRITGISRTAPYHLSLQWKSIAGVNYRVHRSPNLDREESEILSPELQATGDVTEWSWIEGLQDPKAFFWVEVLPPPR